MVTGEEKVQEALTAVMSPFGKLKTENSPGGTRVSLKILVGKSGVNAP